MIEISSQNLLHNIKVCRDKLSKNIQITGVVKANAYGHGLKEVVSVIEDKIDLFQVDDLLELKKIRQYTKKPVLVFGFVSEKELEEAVSLDGVLGVYNLDIVEKLNSIAEKQNKSIKIHVKIDAMIGRQGILVDQVKDFFTALKEFNKLEVVAIYSHFSNIEDEIHLSHAKVQYKILMKAKKIAQGVGFKNISHHISATSGFLTDQKNNWGGTILRLGIGLYGLWPSLELQKSYEKEIDFKPVLSWKTEVVQVKEVPVGFPIGYGCTFKTDKPTKIAVIPQGYGDGYDRKFSNNSNVLIGGVRCPVLGRVAMNMFVVEVSNLERVSVGEEVVLIGKQADEEITVEELAEKIDTINYEIVTRIWPDLPRVIK